jgi:hypothetical protein
MNMEKSPAEGFPARLHILALADMLNAWRCLRKGLLAT